MSTSNDTPKIETNAKAYTAAITTFIGLAGALFGTGEMPAEGEILQAVMYIATAAAGAGVSGFLTWFKSNKSKPATPAIRNMVIPFLLFLLVACSTSPFGETETPTQRAFQSMGKHVWYSIPIQKFLVLPASNPEVVANVCLVHSLADKAFADVRAAYNLGGDNLTAAISGLNGAIASMSLAVIGDFKFPGKEDIPAKTLLWAQVGAASIPSMRIFRKQYLISKLGQIVSEDRDPTAAEIDELNTKLTELRESINARCSVTS